MAQAALNTAPQLQPFACRVSSTYQNDLNKRHPSNLVQIQPSDLASLLDVQAWVRDSNGLDFSALASACSTLAAQTQHLGLFPDHSGWATQLCHQQPLYAWRTTQGLVPGLSAASLPSFEAPAFFAASLDLLSDWVKTLVLRDVRRPSGQAQFWFSGSTAPTDLPLPIQQQCHWSPSECEALTQAHQVLQLSDFYQQDPCDWQSSALLRSPTAQSWYREALALTAPQIDQAREVLKQFDGRFETRDWIILSAQDSLTRLVADLTGRPSLSIRDQWVVIGPRFTDRQLIHWAANRVAKP